MGTELIGRDSELSIVSEFLDRVEEGPASLLVEGEPGIGKSVLWQRAVEEAQGRLRVLSSCPSRSEVQLPFVVLNDVLDPVFTEILPTLAAPRRNALEVALLRAQPRRAPPNPQAVALATLDALRAVSASEPVLVAIDDAPWMDTSSGRALRFVFRRVELEPIRLLITARTRDAGDVQVGMDAQRVPSRRLRLGPLSVAAISRLLSTRLNASIPRHILLRLHEQSGGNPFYALQIARVLLGRGFDDIGPHDPLPVPPALRDMIAERLSALSVRARRAALYAAALSKPTIGALAVLRDGASLVDALDEAVSAEIIEVRGQHVRFAHPLLASVLYSDARASERRAVHAELADAVADAEERGRHVALAAIGPDAAAALALDEAARAAAVRGAPAAAAALFEDAHGLTPSDDVAQGFRRAIGAIDHHLAAGDLTAAEQLAAALLPVVDSGIERASLRYRLASIRGRQYSWAEADRMLEAASRDAIGSGGFLSKIYQERAAVGLVRGDVNGAATNARLALSAARDGADREQEANATIRLALYQFILGRGFEPELLAHVAALEGTSVLELGDPLPMFDLEVAHAIMLKWADDFGGARTRLEERYRRAHELGNEAALPFILYHLSELEAWAGDLERAESYASEGKRIAEVGEQGALRPAVLYASALVDAYRGRVDEARCEAEGVLDACAQTGNVPVTQMAHAVLGFLALSLGDVAATERQLGVIGDSMAAIGAGEPGLVRFHADEIEALVALGDLERAERMVEYLAERGRSLDRPWTLVACARGRALLQAATGQPEAALDSIERALLMHARLPMPFELGRTLLVRGTTQRRMKRKRAARDSLEAALQIFERIGTPLWSDRARSELRRIGIRPPSPLALSATEERVAALVAAGHTNREVASALFMSVKTVDSNLSRIYRKLGVRSRTELAHKILSANGTADRP